jgi:hypothetical protein
MMSTCLCTETGRTDRIREPGKREAFFCKTMWFFAAPTITDRRATATAPAELVIVSLTRYVPGFAYVWCGVAVSFDIGATDPSPYRRLTLFR